MNLEQYLNEGVETLVKGILSATFKNPLASAHFARYALAAKRAEATRHRFERQGEHIPSFLIASITGDCNLRCAGCYDRANHAACGCSAELLRDDWARVFCEAEALGIAAILLAGGEPLMRMDVIEQAALHPSILFPVFTNGTLLDEKLMPLLKKRRNLIPIISIEGSAALTDARRGEGVFAQTESAMQRLQDDGLLFGASITVTSENLSAVTDDVFIGALRAKGCRAVVFVEYVPVEKPELALTGDDRRALADAVARLRQINHLIVISFPGDEAESSGCLAAGRGFFHINAAGGAEPCPFSPYSDVNIKDMTLREALQSPLFVRLRADESLRKDHAGGCALFEQADYVRSLLS